VIPTSASTPSGPSGRLARTSIHRGLTAGRLRDIGNSEDALVELDRVRFMPCGHRQLHGLEPIDVHALIMRSTKPVECHQSTAWRAWPTAVLLAGLSIKHLPSRVRMASVTCRLVDEMENHPTEILALSPAVSVG
jgi:hypothetical protein